MVLQSEPTALSGPRVYESILDLIPDADNPTPLVKLNRVTPYEHTEVYVKLEWYNFREQGVRGFLSSNFLAGVPTLPPIPQLFPESNLQSDPIAVGQISRSTV